MAPTLNIFDFCTRCGVSPTVSDTRRCLDCLKDDIAQALKEAEEAYEDAHKKRERYEGLAAYLKLDLSSVPD